jgi:hypothetical protein
MYNNVQVVQICGGTSHGTPGEVGKVSGFPDWLKDKINLDEAWCLSIMSPLSVCLCELLALLIS